MKNTWCFFISKTASRREHGYLTPLYHSDSHKERGQSRANPSLFRQLIPKSACRQQNPMVLDRVIRISVQATACHIAQFYGRNTDSADVVATGVDLTHPGNRQLTSDKQTGSLSLLSQALQSCFIRIFRHTSGMYYNLRNQPSFFAAFPYFAAVISLKAPVISQIYSGFTSVLPVSERQAAAHAGHFPL